MEILSYLLGKKASGGGGGSNFTIEEGSFTYEEDDHITKRVYFNKTHTKTPALIIFYDNGETLPEANYSTLHFTYIDYTKFGMNNQTTKGYTRSEYQNTGVNARNSVIKYDTSYDTPSGDNTYARYFVREDSFYPYSNNTNERWRKGRTYKWLAIWTDE